MYFGIRYILYKLRVTAGRLAPADSGRLKLYSQYSVNSSVILHWIQACETSLVYYFPLCSQAHVTFFLTSYITFKIIHFKDI